MASLAQVLQQPPTLTGFPRSGVFRLHATGHPGGSPCSSPSNLPSSSMHGARNVSIPSPGPGGSPSELNRAFDFFTEDDNQRFINAIDTSPYPPQCEALASRMGNKTPQQINNYATLYVEAVNSRRQAARAQGKSTDFHITAADVYNFHGIGQAFTEFSRHSHGSPAEAAPSRLSTESAMSGAATSNEKSASRSKTSIEFLCGGSSPPSPPRAEPPPRPMLPHMMAIAPSLQFYAGGGLPHFQRVAVQPAERSFLVEMLPPPRSHAAPSVKRDAHAQQGGAQGGARKEPAEPERKRARSEETRMDVELAEAQRAHEDAQRLLIPHEKIWSYSAMSQQQQSKDEELKGKNPWEWSRKVIVKKEGGYAQWWPLFQDCVVLSKRETSDDMRLIKGKAPPPVPWQANQETAAPFGLAAKGAAPERALPKKLGARGRTAGEVREKASRGSHSDLETLTGRSDRGWGGGSSIKELAEWPRVGEAVEVKWQGEWWHATVKKNKWAWDKSRIEKVFVTYVGGTEAENEWIPISRIRVPREDAPVTEQQVEIEAEEDAFDDSWEEDEPEFRPNKPAAKGRGGARGVRGGRGGGGKAKRGAAAVSQ